MMENMGAGKTGMAPGRGKDAKHRYAGEMDGGIDLHRSPFCTLIVGRKTFEQMLTDC